MRRDDFNIMSNIKVIEGLKADLICVIGQLFKLMTKGANVAKDDILNSISGAISLLYILADRMGYSYEAVDEEIKRKLKEGIIEQDEIEVQGKDLSKLYNHLRERNK
ncbi:MAG: MazG-like family protein [Clostridiaceae bacterium]